MEKTGTVSNETISHFSCGECKKWWTIGDADKSKSYWFCPWCGTKQDVEQK
jgi:DNA-directed RNA polymerase subunit RPC12/RpoP